MKKLFISADIEGSCGIASWDETDKTHPDYAYFADQMTREVRAACEGAFEAGVEEVLVRDAHDSARNLNPRELPPYARLIRGWGGHPYSMMQGLDASFCGVVCTGYHAAAGMDSNPLAHTMNTEVSLITINGEIASELMINAMTAAYEGVAVYAVSGDRGLCAWMKGKSPGTVTIPVHSGQGNSNESIHPNEAVRRIREGVREAVKQASAVRPYPLPDSFQVEIAFREHRRAQSGSFYPGMLRLDARTLRFEAEDYFEVLRMLHFVL